MKSFKSTGGSDPGEPPASGARNANNRLPGPEALERDTRLDDRPGSQALPQGPGMEARRAFLGHALMENRSDLLVDACLTKVSGHAERIVSLAMIEPYADRPRPIALGANRAHEAEDRVNELRFMNMFPHVTQNPARSRGRSASDGRTTRHPGHAASQACASAWRRARLDESCRRARPAEAARR